MNNLGRYSSHSTHHKLDQVVKNLQQLTSSKKKTNWLSGQPLSTHHPSVPLARPGNFFLQVGHCPWHRNDSPRQSCGTMRWSLDGPSTPRLSHRTGSFRWAKWFTTGSKPCGKWRDSKLAKLVIKVCFEQTHGSKPKPLLSPFTEIASSFASMI